jgi:D-arginine dehydrogenase
MQPQPEVVIVGAGIAGAALAYQLTRRGLRDVLILEQEAMAGMHSSGRNAAMFYGLIDPPQLTELGALTRRFLLDPPEGVFPSPLLTATGSVTIYGEGQEAALKARLELAARARVETQILSAGEVERLVPYLCREGVTQAVFCPVDGLLDISTLLQGLLNAARRRGAQIAYQQQAHALCIEGGRVTGVHTGQGTISCRAVVDASGAWAGILGSQHGAVRPPLTPLRRHLLYIARESRAGPLIVDARQGFYIRPETGGYLFSACDEDPHPPGMPGVDPVRIAEALDRAERTVPGLRPLKLQRSWAGLRTRLPDETFVLGQDPLLPGYFWMAGLGGHGMCTGVAAADLVAAQLTGEEPELSWASPERFLESWAGGRRETTASR